jgi:hypothetical protein
MGSMRYACKILVGRPEAKRPLGKTNSKWENSIKMKQSKKMSTGLIWLRIGSRGGNL